MSLCSWLDHIWFKLLCFKLCEIIVSNDIDMKYLGKANVILDIKIATRSEKRIFFGSISICWEYQGNIIILTVNMQAHLIIYV